MARGEAVTIELRGRARPLRAARVTMHLQPEGEARALTIIENPANPLNLLPSRAER